MQRRCQDRSPAQLQLQPVRLRGRGARVPRARVPPFICMCGLPLSLLSGVRVPLLLSLSLFLSLSLSLSSPSLSYGR